MILYFSGTGNSEYVAKRIAKEFSDVALSIEKCDGEIKLYQNEMLGIVTPTNFWELPILTREFLKKMIIKGSSPSYTFIVATYGTTPGCTYSDAKKILKTKNIHLSAGFGVKMPDNWTPIFNLSNKEKVKKIKDNAEKYINEAILLIKNKKIGNHMKNKMPYLVRAFTDPVLNNERKTKNFYVEDCCIGCGLCARHCPVKAIDIKEKKPVWIKEKCALCLRCLHHCPKFAIQYGNGKTKKNGQYKNPPIFE